MTAEHRPDKRRTERRYKGQTRAQAVERRAKWVLEHWIDRPSLLYAGMKADVQKHFECGIGAAEQAIARAYEIMRDTASEFTGDRMAVEYFELLEECKRTKDRTNARKTLDSLRAHLGLGAPDRVEVTGQKPPGRAMGELTDEELAILAKANKPL